MSVLISCPSCKRAGYADADFVSNYPSIIRDGKMIDPGRDVWRKVVCPDCSRKHSRIMRCTVERVEHRKGTLPLFIENSWIFGTMLMADWPEIG